MKSTSLAAIAALIYLVGGAGVGAAQNPATLRVTVQDQSGAVVPGATVTVSRSDNRVAALATDDRGVAEAGLLSGRHTIRVEADGFEPRELRNVNVKAGSNRLGIQLEVKRLAAEVRVVPEELLNAFGSILTPEQIAALPDDPDEFERVIEELAGPGGSIRVNGFRGGRLPPKSQIREIRIRMNPYSTENHEFSHMGVDIFTKPGLPDWHGSWTTGFRDEAISARNPFAPFRGPEQRRRFGVSLDGPLRQNRTSFFLNAEGNLSYDSRTIVAALPTGVFNSLALRPSRQLDASARVEHALTESHSLRVEFQRNATTQRNMGVGEYDLPERAYSTNQTERLFRLSDSGLLTKSIVNEFRFQSRWQHNEAAPSFISSDPTVTVLNAFTRGITAMERDRRSRQVELVDNLDFVVGRHAMKAGIQIESAAYRSRERINYNGTFIFSSLDAFRAGQPTTYSQRSGQPEVRLSQQQLGIYFQDEWRVRRNVALSAGLRYEAQSNASDRTNLAPRAGVAWNPWRNRKTTVRLGAGIFYDWVAAATIEQALRVNGTSQSDLVIRQPGYPDPFSSGGIVRLPASRLVLDPNLELPKLVVASASVEQPLGEKYQIRMDVSRQRGTHVLRSRNLNAPFQGSRPAVSDGNVLQVESSAGSSATELRVQFSRQPPGDFHWLVNYGWSRQFNDTDSSFSLPADNYDLRSEWGNAATEMRHRVFGLWSLRLPRGFTTSSTFRLNTGTPFNITTGLDGNGDTNSNDRPVGLRRNSGRGDWQWDYGTRLSWDFGLGPEVQNRGGPQIRVLRGGPDADMLGQLGTRDIQRRYKVQLYVQATNLFNHTNRINFSGVLSSPFFGAATAAQPARRFETGLRFSF